MNRSARRVLLIEPNRLIAVQCETVLRRRGYEVTWSKNAQDAISAADRDRPDIVILEILLSAHSGIEFLHEFRSYSEWKKVPVIIFSRIARMELSISEITLEKLGVHSFLYKPETSLARLTDRVDTLLASAAV